MTSEATIGAATTNANGNACRAARILARSLVRDMLARGFDTGDVLGLAAELVDRAADARQLARGPIARRRQRG
ncbi:MAG: hypothetical protein JO257_01130 [Deltaproteobacteria bacterium]|nr:hypothetical protein [Deltaproteobacteria bacterium]